MVSHGYDASHDIRFAVMSLIRACDKPPSWHESHQVRVGLIVTMSIVSRVLAAVMQLCLTPKALGLLRWILLEDDRLSRSEVPSSLHVAVDNCLRERLLIGPTSYVETFPGTCS